MPKITDRTISTFKPGAVRCEFADSVLPGLYLIVQPSGARSWAVRYRIGRRSRKLTLGPYPRIGLAAARDDARKAMEAVSIGNDPITVRRLGNAADDTLAAHIALYKKNYTAELREGTRDYWERELDRMQDIWPGRALRSITKKDCIGLIDARKADGPHAVDTTYKVAKAFFRFCEVREDDFKSPMAAIEPPAKLKTEREKRQPRKRVLNDAELRAVWRKADKVGRSAGALAKLLILTGCRKNEIAQLERREVTTDAIELPGKRTKNGEDHRVALTPLMREVLATCPKTGFYVLNGGDITKEGDARGTTGPMDAGGRVKKKLAVNIPPWTLHDLRRSFRSGLARLGIPGEVAEKCINHKSGSHAGIVATYNVHDYEKEMADAFTRWSDHVAAIVK